jgi:hypothetical protein
MANLSHLSSGVRDILITGKVSYAVDFLRTLAYSSWTQTGSRHGDAWGHFTIRGRVRAWDGLVVLLRFPVRTNSVFLKALIYLYSFFSGLAD